MKPIDNGFGWIEIRPVTVRKKNALILMENKAVKKVRTGVPLHGRYKDKIVIYQAHVEVAKEYQGEEHVYIPADACFGVYELEDHEYIDDPVWVSKDVGKDVAWYG